MASGPVLTIKRRMILIRPPSCLCLCLGHVRWHRRHQRCAADRRRRQWCDDLRLGCHTAPASRPRHAEPLDLPRRSSERGDRRSAQGAGSRKLGFRVPDQEVENAFGRVARGNGMDVATFSKQLRDSGVSPDALKSRYRADIAWNAVLRVLARDGSKLSNAELSAAVRDKASRLKRPSSIMIFNPSSSSFRVGNPATSKWHWRVRRGKNSTGAAAALIGCAAWSMWRSRLPSRVRHRK